MEDFQSSSKRPLKVVSLLSDDEDYFYGQKKVSVNSSIGISTEKECPRQSLLNQIRAHLDKSTVEQLKDLLKSQGVQLSNQGESVKKSNLIDKAISLYSGYISDIGKVSTPFEQYEQIVSVDVGVKNLAVAIYDLKLKRVIAWELRNPDSERCLNTPAVESYGKWCRDFLAYHNINSKCRLLVERQRVCSNNGVINAKSMMVYTVQSQLVALHDKAITIDPKAVAQHYASGGKQKKRNAVDIIYRDYMHLLETDVGSQFKNAKKKDDLADSLLQLTYFLHVNEKMYQFLSEFDIMQQ
ncbi:hypothetical protein MP228_003795 [Amoeboaphelidium protococcarum]|nr:hypothetical protein MP228_004034 [Amoeboaphelidium protococcarum]KAI3651043.1 hypothetical protein MP228_004524 [Amoeboaphelidium protococcarum]KAI3651349.1 hypothetical protein MP228_003795 [Amoeboaphelidium protococcarum]